MKFKPAYLKSLEEGKLRTKVEQTWQRLKECALCPRQCKINRLKGQTGFCKTGSLAKVASYGPHFGEEKPLVGESGSGTIFFSNCNLLCLFCQNYEISHIGEGREVNTEQLAAIMLELQASGCLNINFVTPSHVVAQILAAVELAARKGLRIPLVYNSGGYDNVQTIRLLDGVIDIYMPDFKFWKSSVGKRICKASNYPEVARNCIKAMFNQVGDLVLDDRGYALRGLLVRHLVLPNNLAETGPIMEYLANSISTDTYVNVMAQYRPCGLADGTKDLARRLSEDEYNQALMLARKAGLQRLDPARRVFLLW